MFYCEKISMYYNTVYTVYTLTKCPCIILKKCPCNTLVVSWPYGCVIHGHFVSVIHEFSHTQLTGYSLLNIETFYLIFKISLLLNTI